MSVFGQSSGTTAYDPPLSDMSLDILDRLQIRPSEIQDHMFSMRRTMNLLLTRWANRGVNLWRVDPTPTTINLIQGVATYQLPSDTVDMLDTYIRTYQIGNATSLAPSFVTTVGSPIVTVNQPSAGAVVGSFCQIVIPVSIGGLIIFGYYQIASVTSTSQFTIVAASNATANASGGQVPAFTTTALSSLVSVNLPNHGVLPGQQFLTQVQTLVGGIFLFGGYLVTSVTDANNFVIMAQQNALSAQTVSENGGQCQIGQQVQPASPVDILVYPISRNDYAALPNKSNQGRPSNRWFNRQLTPTLTLWPVPDANGPYQINAYLMRQIQDMNPTNGQVGNLPYRFLYAFVAGCAADMAIKYRPDLWQALKLEAEEAWQEAADMDREKVPFFLTPDFTGYMNNS